MKNILATVVVAALLSFLLSCPSSLVAGSDATVNATRNPVNVSDSYNEISISSIENHQFHSEVAVVFILLLLLVWLLNREFETSYRLSFYGSFKAMKDKVGAQSMKDQLEWLLQNIIPQHVANCIKTSAKYSQNHKGVGVMFASIVNFNELYDESYMGGREYLRILNELVGDFDELLQRPEFKNIEKIKTIGSTYMAASGLNSELRESNTDEHQHIFELVEFAKEMQGVVRNFNQNLLEFNLIVRIGLNFGDVTAGVIGTTMLYYDIWGDTVNIASRMDSTGVSGRIQVSEQCSEVLQERYNLESRGQVFVKGKDNMNVFLLRPEEALS